MNIHFVIELRKRIASISRDPHGPDRVQQKYIVKLKPPVTEGDHVHRLANAQDWCREQVDHFAGHRWAWRRVVEDDSIEYFFSDDMEAVIFKMVFG